MDAQALGRYLRETREAKELTLDEAEHALRIRRRILESFEAGEFNIPEFAAIQIRGFMRNYARYLGLEEDRIVSYYEEALRDSTNPKRLSGRQQQGRPGKKDKRDSSPSLPVAPRSITDTPPSLPAVPIQTQSSNTEPRRRSSPFSVLLRLLVAVAAIAVIAYVVIQLVQTQTNTSADPQAGGIFGTLAPTQTITLEPTNLVVILPTSPPNLQPNFTGSGVLVSLTTTERTWLKITSDGKDQYVGIARPGVAAQYPAGDNVTIIASNAAALNVVYNGQQQATFGGVGQMVTVIFSTTGVQISSGPGYQPTPINSPTPMSSPTDAAGTLIAQLTPSDTPGPSPTPSDTLTPTLTPTDTLVPTETPVPSDTLTPSDTPTITLTPSNTPVPSNTPTLTFTPTFTLTPSNTPVPTATPIPSDTPIPSATSILPPREADPGATPTKNGK